VIFLFFMIVHPGLYPLSDSAEMLLTSVGTTTEPIQERLLDMARGIGDLAGLRILRLADGWAPFAATDDVSLIDRLYNRVESTASKPWSKRYIGYVLGNNVTIRTRYLGGLDKIHAAEIINQADMLLAPGGNTWQAIKGLQPHKDALKRAVGAGVPYLGESAGSIIAGITTHSARLEPADTAPANMSTALHQGLGFVNFDIVVHATGRAVPLAIPGPQACIANIALRSYETPQSPIEEFTARNVPITTIALNDSQAIAVTKGKIATI
jgi:peptidase E